MTSYIQNLEIHKWIQQLIPTRRETGNELFVLKSISQIVERKKIRKQLHRGPRGEYWDNSL
jgi:hypothetical protein